MRWFLYNLLFAVGYILLLPQFLLRMKRRGGYRARFADRLGFLPQEILSRLAAMRGQAVWIHAVSVGEVYVAGQMMRALRARNRSLRFVLSTTSSTGWQEAQKMVAPEDVLIYHPLDFIPCVRRALDAVCPRALILTESEIWPNMILGCRDRDIPVFLINARMSDRSAPRYAALRYWFKPVLRAMRLIFAQSALDKERLVAAGAEPETVQVTGSFKFDVAARDPEKEAAVAEFLAKTGMPADARILLGGSTWPGEDAVLVRAYLALRAKYPDLRLVIVPRHFEKADAVQAEIEKAGLVCIRKSRAQVLVPADSADAVWLGDTTGELMGFYGNAKLVFVGKSLCEHGAQNMIEPCLCGAATLIGPNTENFRPVMSDLLEAGALIQVQDENGLIAELDKLLADEGARQKLGSRAAEAVQRRKGCVAACAGQMLDELRAKAVVEPVSGNERSFGWGIWPFLAQFLLGVFVAGWQRAMDVLAGRTFWSLAYMIGVLLVGFVFGIIVAGGCFRRVRWSGRFFPIVFLLAAGGACLLLGAVGGIPGDWQRLLVNGARSPALLFTLLMKTALLFFALPAFLSGCIAQMTELTYLRSPARESSRAVFFFFVTGAVPLAVGYWLGGRRLLPWMGEDLLTHAVLWGFSILAICSAVTSRHLSTRFKARHLLAILAVIAVASALVHLARARRTAGAVMSCGTFSRLIHRDSGFAQGRPMFERITPRHIVAVYDDRDYGFVFTQDGRPLLFGSRFHTARIFSAYLPLLLHSKADRVAVVGAEAGFYLPFFHRGGVVNLDYASADPMCVRLALAADRYIIEAPDEGAFVPSGKAAVVPGAGYDIIFLAPEPVWMRGTSASYGAAHFKKCRDALAADGIAALHLDTRALSTSRFVTVVRAFLKVFPHAQFWSTGMYDWVLVGSANPIEASASDMLSFFERSTVARDFARAGVLSLPEVFPSLLCDEEGLRPWLERSNGECTWQSAWRLPQLALGEGLFPLKLNQVEGSRQRSLTWLKQGALDEDLYLAIRNKTDRNMDARKLAVMSLAEMDRPLNKKEAEQTFGAAKDAARINPRDILLSHFASSLELEGRRRIALGEFEGAQKCYENLLAFDANHAAGQYGMGFCLRAVGKNEEAYDHFVRAVGAMPKQTDYRLELAQISSTLENYEEAERQYREILRLEPNNAEALYRYAVSLTSKSRPKCEYAEAIKLAEKACALTDWNVSEYAFGLADMYMDAGRVMEGMGLKRRLKERGVKPIKH